jgi:hypothetical protein
MLNFDFRFMGLRQPVVVGRERASTFPPRREGFQPFAPYKKGQRRLSSANRQSKIENLK